MFAQPGSLVVVPCACSPSPTHSRCRVCFHAWLGSWWWCHVPTHLVPHTPGTMFAFVLGWDLGGGTMCLLTLSHALSAPCLLLRLVGILVVAPCARLPSPMHSRRHSACSILSRTPSTMCLLALPRTLLVLLCMLALSRALLALCAHSPSFMHSWHHCARSHLPHTPGTAFAFTLSRYPWWWYYVPVLAPSRPLPCHANAKGLDR
jgi:hypothetical protein